MRSEPRGPRRDLHSVAEPVLEWVDRTLYVLVAILFLLAALGMGIYAVAHLVEQLDNPVPDRIIEFVNDLLLVLIILEVYSTVQSFLKTHTTSLQPFLYIGIISATRRILAIGAATTLDEATVSQTLFRNRMVDLAINGGVVLTLALALFLFARRGHVGEFEAQPEIPDHDEDA